MPSTAGPEDRGVPGGVPPAVSALLEEARRAAALAAEWTLQAENEIRGGNQETGMMLLFWARRESGRVQMLLADLSLDEDEEADVVTVRRAEGTMPS